MTWQEESDEPSNVKTLKTSHTTRLDFTLMAPASHSIGSPYDVQLEQIKPNVLALLYPPYCSGPQFTTTCDACTKKLVTTDYKFSLLHDFRRVLYNKVDWQSDFEFLKAARTVADRGYVKSVALVLNYSPFLLSTVNAALWMSPVQPVQIFSDHEAALAWCSAIK